MLWIIIKFYISYNEITWENKGVFFCKLCAIALKWATESLWELKLLHCFWKYFYWKVWNSLSHNTLGYTINPFIMSITSSFTADDCTLPHWCVCTYLWENTSNIVLDYTWIIFHTYFIVMHSCQTWVSESLFMLYSLQWTETPKYLLLYHKRKINRATYS